MPRAGSAVSGTLVAGWWSLRDRLARTRRPALARFLAAALAATGLILFLEGVVVGWLLPVVAPTGLGFDSLFAQNPWLQSAYWLSGVLLFVAGCSSVLAGLVMARRPSAGTYLAVAQGLFLLGTGAVLTYCGARFGAGLLLALGVVNIVSWLAVSVILVLCWYTLDPLGLHWQGP